MKKLSKRYRNDELVGIPNDIRALLDREYLSRQPNLERENPKILVVFSGTSGVGKSTLSKRIEFELGGLVIENDGIKRCLIKYRPELSHRERGKVTWEYTMDLYTRLAEVTCNGLIVRDAVIDWYFDLILPIFAENGYLVFVIKYDISTTKNLQLLEQRGDTKTQTLANLVDILPEQHMHMKRFSAFHMPDVILNDDNLYHHEEVISLLRKKIKELE